VETVSVEIAIATGIAVEIGIAAATAAISALVIVRTSVNARSSAIVQSSVIAQISASAQSNETATSTAENSLLASRRPPARSSPARAPLGRTQVATALPYQDRSATAARASVSGARAVSVAAGAGADGAAAGVGAAEAAARASKVCLAVVKRWALANPLSLIIPNHMAMHPRAVMGAKNPATRARGVSTTDRGKAASTRSDMSRMVAAKRMSRTKAASVVRAVSATNRRASPRHSRVLRNPARYRRSSSLYTLSRAASETPTSSRQGLPKGTRRNRASLTSSGLQHRRPTRWQPVEYRKNSQGFQAARPRSCAGWAPLQAAGESAGGASWAQALTDVAQQAARGGLDQVQHFLETIRPAVVRVRHLARTQLRRELEKQSDAIMAIAGRNVFQRGEILAIHRENQIELLEIQLLN